MENIGHLTRFSSDPRLSNNGGDYETSAKVFRKKGGKITLRFGTSCELGMCPICAEYGHRTNGIHRGGVNQYGYRCQEKIFSSLEEAKDFFVSFTCEREGDRFEVIEPDGIGYYTAVYVDEDHRWRLIEE